MSFEPRDYLRHIQIEINFLIQTSTGVTLDRFLDDATLQRDGSEAVAGNAAARA
jgi:hypothetical protein